MISRKKLADDLKAFFFMQDSITAVWESGSAATGWLDENSDMDIAVICDDGREEPLLAELDRYLEANYGIDKRHRVPEPAWHGFTQCFYRIKDTPELFYLDICFIKKSSPDKFTDTDRHGIPVIWFSRDELPVFEPSSREAVKKRGKKLYETVAGTDFLILTELKKAIRRGIYAETFVNYFQVVRGLSVLMNLKYRPEKADFGLRYACRDYPEKEYEFIVNALKISSLEDIIKKLAGVQGRFNALKTALENEWA